MLISKSRDALALSLSYADFSVFRGCLVFPKLLLAPWSEVDVEVRVKVGAICATFQHRWTSLAQRASCSLPALLPEGILETKVCRDKDAYFGPVAAQLHEDQHSHDLLLPLAPITVVPNPQQPSRRGCGSPHCTTQAVK